ncbi:MAG: hypothetical protein U1F43_03570 [Myxococcota bacterium]
MPTSASGPSLILVAVLPFALAACPAETGVHKAAPAVDGDHDGLTDRYESEGWNISINTTGYADQRELRHVTSDPAKGDTDGDGLSDLQESAARTDPRSTDTDGDGLSDFDEVTRWLTSPVSVDTDGDARGRPGETLAPLFLLFDGQELQLQDVDGKLVPGPEATSPLRADSDGDGLYDREETEAVGGSPTVADRPRLALELTPNGTVGLALVVTYGEDHQEEMSYGSTESESETFANTYGGSASLSESVWAGFGAETSASVTAGIGIGDLGANVAVSEKLTESVGAEAEASLTATLGVDYASTLSRASSVVQNQSRTLTSELTGARLSVAIDLVNRGSLPFTVTNPAVNAWFWSPSGGRVALATLRQDASAPASIALAPGARASVVLEDQAVDPSRMLQLMAAPYAISFSPAQTQLVSASGDQSSFRLAEIAQNTALVVVDPGDAPPTAAYVAANVDRTADGQLAGARVVDALAAMGSELTTTPVDGGVAYIIDGRAPSFYPADTPPPDVGQALGFHFAPPGPRRIREGWFSIVASHRAAAGVIASGDLGETRVMPGDVVSLALLRDLDRDGLSSREEELLGTSDTVIDSDGDGLPDYWEAREGWTVSISDGDTVVATRHVFPQGRSADSDGDGQSDAQERVLGSDPLARDSDGDGVEDGVEVTAGRSPTHIDRAPPTLTLASATTVSGTTATLSLRVEDVKQLVNQLDFEWGDGSHETWRRGDAHHIERWGAGTLAGLSDATHVYPMGGFFTAKITVTDALGDTATLSELEAVATGDVKQYHAAGSLIATANDCPMNTAIQLGLFLTRYAPGSVSPGVPAVDSIGFFLKQGLVGAMQKIYLTFADGTPLLDHPRPAVFPSALPYSYSELLGDQLGGHAYVGGGADHDPGSIVAPDDHGTYTLETVLHNGTPDRTLVYDISANGSGYPRTHLTQSGQPVWTTVCSEDVPGQAFDCQMSVTYAWQTYLQAFADDTSQPGSCSTRYAGSFHFRRSSLL